MEFASNKSFAGKKREREIANTFCLLLDMVAKLYEFEFKLETRRRRRKGRKRGGGGVGCSRRRKRPREIDCGEDSILGHLAAFWCRFFCR